MNLLILEPSEYNGKNYFITGRKRDHILYIWKAKEGDSFSAGRLNESYGTAKVLNILEKEIILSYEPTRSIRSPTLFLELYSAFQRPQTMKKIFQLSATWGIRKIFFFPFDKSEKSYETSSLWKNKNYEQELILGLEQGKRVEMPSVEYSFLSKEKINFNFPELCFLLDLEGKKIFEYNKYFNMNQCKHIGLILGPEGGITEEDRKFFIQKNALPLKISLSTLRSEFALAFALSQLELVFGGLD